MISSAQIASAVDALVAAAAPEKIILFGSHATGRQRSDSDVDLLVIEREVPDRARELVRAAQWELERLLSRLYGQKQEVTHNIVPVLNIALKPAIEGESMLIPDQADQGGASPVDKGKGQS